jgi:hypothetical protein
MYPVNSFLIFVMRLASTLVPSSTMDKQGGIAYFNPTTGGGSMLENAGDGYGEPLNVFSP